MIKHNFQEALQMELNGKYLSENNFFLTSFCFIEYSNCLISIKFRSEIHRCRTKYSKISLILSWLQVWFLLCCFWNFRLRNAVSPAIVWRRRYRIEFFIWLKLRFCKDASKFLKNHHFKFVPCSPVKSTVEILQIFLENMNSNTSNLPQIY